MPEDRQPLSFFEEYDTLTLARRLLGCELIHNSADGVTAGIIVETEAYLHNDPACHAYNKRTLRTEPMYGPAGTIYIYLIYGMYQCINVVSNVKNVGEAVLIRALQPTKGAELMQMRRNLYRKNGSRPTKDIKLRALCNGPGKLVTAMRIDRLNHNNQTFTEGNVYISKPALNDFNIITTTRIGINVGVDLPYRFYIENNIFVSK